MQCMECIAVHWLQYTERIAVCWHFVCFCFILRYSCVRYVFLYCRILSTL